MTLLMSIALWLSTMFGIENASGDVIVDVGDRQTMGQDASKSNSSNEGKKRGLTRKGYIYNGF